MLPHSPSELQRIHEETLDNERTFLLNKIHNSFSKSEKALALSRVREIERELGIESAPFNSNSFGG